MEYKKIVHSHYKYELTKPYWLILDDQYQESYDDGTLSLVWSPANTHGYLTQILRMEAGFRWDGNSGAIDTSRCLEASLVHDALCNIINEKYSGGPLWEALRKQADEQYYQDMLREGKCKAWAWTRKQAMSLYRWKRARQLRRE